MLFRILLVILLSTSTFVRSQFYQDTVIYCLNKAYDIIPEGFAISLALIDNDSVNFIGFMQKDGNLIEVNNRDSLFEIGSITKVFTSTVLARNVIDDKVKLNDRVDKVFPFRFNKGIRLSYLSLSNHTSGMYRLPFNMMDLMFENPENPYSKYSYKMLDEYLKKGLKLEQADSIIYAYSNLGTGVLAYSLSMINKMPFELLVKQFITDKYDLISTTYEGPVSYTGIGKDGALVSNWQFNALMGAGGLISTSSDLSKFILAQFDSSNRELSLTRKETYSISENLSIGLAWHIIEPTTTSEIFWHNGGTGGYTSSIAMSTNNQTGVVILSNISPSYEKTGVLDELCFDLLDLLKE